MKNCLIVSQWLLTFQISVRSWLLFCCGTHFFSLTCDFIEAESISLLIIIVECLIKTSKAVDQIELTDAAALGLPGHWRPGNCGLALFVCNDLNIVVDSG